MHKFLVLFLVSSISLCSGTTMKIIDISWPITEKITQYKDRKDVHFTDKRIFEKEQVRSTIITLGSHTGTHIDAPSHFIQDGDTVETFPLEKLIGRCVVIDCTHVKNAITTDDIKSVKLLENAIVLFKTKNSALSPTAPFEYNFIYLDQSAAEYLAQQKVKAVGIDYLGIERNQPGHETHKALLQMGIPIIEGLRLQYVKPGEYELFCLPIAIQGLEAAPARAILLKK